MRFSSSSPVLLIPKFQQDPVKNPSIRPDFWFLPTLIVLSIIVVYWLDTHFYLDLYRYGLLPRTISGLGGILTTPFIHSSLSHLFNNVVPLAVLLIAIGYFYAEIAYKIYLVGYLVTGLLVWVIARESYHVGASGQVYAFAAFIFFSGILRGKVHLLAISLLVAFLYGGLFWGIFPFHAHISWESHLAGGFTGFITALYFRQHEPYYTSPLDNPRDKSTSFIKLYPKSPAEFETSISDIRYRYVHYQSADKK